MSEIQDPLAQVFAKAPPYTREELELVVARYRESRNNFIAAGGKKVPAPKKAKAAPGAKIDITDLDLSGD